MNVRITDIGVDQVQEATDILRSARYDLYVDRLHVYNDNEFMHVYGSEIKEAEFWEKRLAIARADKRRYFSKLAYIDNQAVGFIYGRIKLDSSKILLSKLYIRTGYNGQGIGTYLAKAFLEWAGSLPVYVLVEQSNQQAYTFYKKFNFVRTGKTLSDKGMTSIWLKNSR